MLNELGLNNSEAEIYLTLLLKPNLTGYKIAREISKPVANTYKGLNQLANKGLVVFSESDGVRLYSVLDINEYMDRMENELKQKRDKVVSALKKVEVKNKEFGNYNLSDDNQVYEKAKTLIVKSTDVLLIDCFPIPFEHLKETIEKKQTESNLNIRLKLYTDSHSPCKKTTVAYNGNQIIEEWIGHWLIICKDSEETLIASFSKQEGKLMHAVWSTDPFICFIIYNGLVNEFMLIDILNIVHRNKEIHTKELNDIHRQYKSLYDYEVNAGNKIMQTVFQKKTPDEN